MQTFLPLPDFAETAGVLDRQRLGKQRVETRQILMALAGLTEGWRNHPAVRMWRGHERALARYGLAICGEWVRRGYTDNQAEVIATLHDLFPPETAEFPAWLGDPAFHAAHRSKLIEKAPMHYGPVWPDTKPGADYVWPDPAAYKEAA